MTTHDPYLAPQEHPYLAKYPEKELMVTAQLFGQLISHGLMEKDALATAMHMVHKSIQPVKGR